MEFKGKLVNQTWENGKNLILGPILARLAKIWAPRFVFQQIYLYEMLDIVASYYDMQFQGNHTIQTR